MEIGIFGLPLSGKTTLFNLLTGTHAETGFSTGKKKANLGVSRVPDARLDKLSAIWNPKKTTYATIRYVDVAGVEKSAEKGLSSEVLTNLKNTDALLLVLRAFDDESVPHPEGSVDPLRDAKMLIDEMLLSDMVIVENRLDRIAKQMKGKERDEALAEKALIERLGSALEGGTMICDVELGDDERRILRGYQFLTQKPLIFAINVGEKDVPGAEAAAAKLSAGLAMKGAAVTWMCATVEQEISELSAEDAAAFLADLGISESATDRIIRTSYGLLGLVSYFTMGEDECRAWTVKRGAKAPEAAGVIHSDLERGFIRAEVVHYDDFVNSGSVAACREKGLYRLEGKEYVVKDGDILNIRFSV